MSIFRVQGAEGSAGWPQDRRGAGVEGRGGSFSWGVVSWGLKWEGHIERSKTKMEQFLGVLGRAGSVQSHGTPAIPMIWNVLQVIIT